MPVDVIMGTGQANQESYTSTEWIKHITEAMSVSHQEARTRLAARQHVQKRDYDLRANVQMYEEGDLVYRRDEVTKVGQSTKLRSPWRGPYLVIKTRHPLYTVKDQKGHYVYHHDKLCLCKDRHVPMWVRRMVRSISSRL